MVLILCFIRGGLKRDHDRDTLRSNLISPVSVLVFRFADHAGAKDIDDVTSLRLSLSRSILA